MASRFFFALCVIALFVAIASAQGVQEPDSDEDVIPRGSLKVAIKLLEKGLQKVFDHVEKKCLIDAVDKCGFNILHPKRLYKCGAAYIEENKEHCIVKKSDH